MSKIKRFDEWMLQKYPLLDSALYNALVSKKGTEVVKAYHEYASGLEQDEDKLFELAEKLADEVYGNYRGVILYSERQELTVKFFKILKKWNHDIFYNRWSCYT